MELECLFSRPILIQNRKGKHDYRYKHSSWMSRLRQDVWEIKTNISWNQDLTWINMYNDYITCMLVLFRSVAASKSNVHTGSYWSSHVYNERTKWYSSLDGNICLIFGNVSRGNPSIVSTRGHWMVWSCFPGVFVHRAHGQPWKFHELLQLLLYRFVASAGRA